MSEHPDVIETERGKVIRFKTLVEAVECQIKRGKMKAMGDEIDLATRTANMLDLALRKLGFKFVQYGAGPRARNVKAFYRYQNKMFIVTYAGGPLTMSIEAEPVENMNIDLAAMMERQEYNVHDETDQDDVNSFIGMYSESVDEVVRKETDPYSNYYSDPSSPASLLSESNIYNRMNRGR